MNCSETAAQQMEWYISVSKGRREKSVLSGFELVISRRSLPPNWTAELPRCPGCRAVGRGLAVKAQQRGISHFRPSRHFSSVANSGYSSCSTSLSGALLTEQLVQLGSSLITLFFRLFFNITFQLQLQLRLKECFHMDIFTFFS